MVGFVESVSVVQTLATKRIDPDSEVKGPVMDQLRRLDFLTGFGGQMFMSHYQALRALDPRSRV